MVSLSDNEKWILHNWSDEKSVEILKRCKEAITCNGNKTGKVLIIDMVVENDKEDGDKKSHETKLFFDMIMMVCHTGKERNEREWAKLLSDAGFNNYKIISLTLSIIQIIHSIAYACSAEGFPTIACLFFLFLCKNHSKSFVVTNGFSIFVSRFFINYF